MLAPVFPKFRRRARPKRTPPAAPPPPPPVALMLVAASYETAASVTLVFDRAVDAGGLDAGQVMVNDLAEAPGVQYVGTGLVAQPDPQSVQIGLSPSGGEPTVPGITLNATSSTGIVAVDDGGIWGGVFGVFLPFP